MIKNLNFSTPIETIKREIEVLGHCVRNISNIKSRITKQFFIDLEPNNNNAEIYDLKYLNNALIKVEPPRKVNDIVQCFRCQEYGHIKTYYTKTFRCVKCSLRNPPTECKKDKDLPAQCVNCLQLHV